VRHTEVEVEDNREGQRQAQGGRSQSQSWREMTGALRPALYCIARSPLSLRANNARLTASSNWTCRQMPSAKDLTGLQRVDIIKVVPARAWAMAAASLSRGDDGS
jgi:hypothetical protein